MYDEYVRKGDFLVPEDDFEGAERAFNKRTKRSRSLDRAFRAPVTTDVDAWEHNQRGLDYPGVDTPTAAPREALGDFPLPGERMDMGASPGRGVKLDPEPIEEPQSIGDMFTLPEEPYDHLREAIHPSDDAFDLDYD